MPKRSSTQSKIGLVVNGVICIVIGFLIYMFVAPNFDTDWPEILYMGCFIWGAGSIFWALKDSFK